MAADKLRISGARPINRPINTKISEEWDDRFWLDKIPNYEGVAFFSKTQGAKRKIIRSTKTSTHQLPKIANSNSSHIASKFKLDITEDQISTLKEELDFLWNSHQIPYFHRNRFQARYISIPSASLSANQIAKEIYELNKGIAPILCAINSTSAREIILNKLKKEIEEIDEKNDELVLQEISENIRNLRLRSLEIIDAVKKWREQIGDRTAEFLWENEDYLEKMKIDIEFLLEGRILDYFNIPHHSNTFTITAHRTGLKELNLHRSIDKFPSKLLLSKSPRTNTKSAEKYLGLNPKKVTPFQKKFPPQESPPLIQEPNESPKSERPSQYESSDEDENEQKIKDTTKLSNEITNNLISKLIDMQCTQITIDGVKEMIAAALVLFTSSILDKFLTEVLSEMIPQVAWEAKQEITDTEYIDFQVQILRAVLEEELLEAANETAKYQIADLLSNEYSWCIPIEEIVEESIAEEKEWNERIVHEVFIDIMSILVEEDWLEILCEDQLSYARLDDMWKILPLNVQATIYKTERPKIIGKIAEDIYFQFLNDYVGKIWVESILSYAINDAGGDESLEVIMPLTENKRKEGRRGTKI